MSESQPCVAVLVCSTSVGVREWVGNRQRAARGDGHILAKGSLSQNTLQFLQRSWGPGALTSEDFLQASFQSNVLGVVLLQLQPGKKYATSELEEFWAEVEAPAWQLASWKILDSLPFDGTCIAIPRCDVSNTRKCWVELQSPCLRDVQMRC